MRETCPGLRRASARLTDDRRWPEKGLVVRQETRFPDDDQVHLEFQCEKPVELSLRIRVPYWATTCGGPHARPARLEVVAGSPGDWTRAAADGGLAFHITQQPRPLTLIPLNRTFGQRFAVYWRVRRA